MDLVLVDVGVADGALSRRSLRGRAMRRAETKVRASRNRDIRCPSLKLTALTAAAENDESQALAQ